MGCHFYLFKKQGIPRNAVNTVPTSWGDDDTPDKNPTLDVRHSHRRPFQYLQLECRGLSSKAARSWGLEFNFLCFLLDNLHLTHRTKTAQTEFAQLTVA